MSIVATTDTVTIMNSETEIRTVSTSIERTVVSSETSVQMVDTESNQGLVETESDRILIVSESSSSSPADGLTESEVQDLIEEALVWQNYQTNDVDSVSSTTYIGKAKLDGTWLIERIVETGDDLAKDYANQSNNVGTTTYTSAWSGRLTLVYGEVQTITGV